MVPSFIPTAIKLPALLTPTHLPLVESAGSPVLKYIKKKIYALSGFSGFFLAFRVVSQIAIYFFALTE